MRTRPTTATLMLTAVLLAGCASGTSSGSGSTSGSGSSDPATVISTVCTRCHPVDRIKAADHDAAGWKTTIDRMRGKGAQLSDDEANQVVEFLASGGASKL